VAKTYVLDIKGVEWLLASIGNHFRERDRRRQENKGRSKQTNENKVVAMQKPVVLTVFDEKEVAHKLEVAPGAQFVAFRALGKDASCTVATIFEQDRQISIKGDHTVIITSYLELEHKAKVVPHNSSMRSVMMD
jgi:hypothetical protein